MKIDRQIGILSVLLQKETVTAPYLAEKFEVSRRTINRDIEDLCKAGIPIVTKQGVNGGISIIENYKLDKTLFTQGEIQDILAGLRSLDSVNGTNRYGQLMEKLSIGSSDFSVVKLVCMGMVCKTQRLSVIQIESNGSGENIGAGVPPKAGANAGFTP